MFSKLSLVLERVRSFDSLLGPKKRSERALIFVYKTKRFSVLQKIFKFVIFIFSRSFGHVLEVKLEENMKKWRISAKKLEKWKNRIEVK